MLHVDDNLLPVAGRVKRLEHLSSPLVMYQFLIEFRGRLKRSPCLGHPAGGFPGFSFTADDYPLRG